MTSPADGQSSIASRHKTLSPSFYINNRFGFGNYANVAAMSYVVFVPQRYFVQGIAMTGFK